MSTSPSGGDGSTPSNSPSTREQSMPLNRPTPSTLMTRLSRLDEQLRELEEQRPLIHEIQTREANEIVRWLEVLYGKAEDDEAYGTLMSLKRRVRNLLIESSTARSSASLIMSHAEEPRYQKSIDVRRLPKFNGSSLEYPTYRAAIQFALLQLPDRADHEKFFALLETLDKKVRGHLTCINPEKPDLKRVLEILDQQYMSGQNVVIELTKEVQQLASVHADSSQELWHEIQKTVNQLLQRVESGSLNETAEANMYHLLCGKLTKSDLEKVEERGPKLKDLALQVESFVNRARVRAQRKACAGDTSKRPADHESRDHRPLGFPKHRSYGRDLQPRFRTNIAVSAPCLFCRKDHVMQKCPLALGVKYRKLKNLGRCVRCFKEHWNRDHRCQVECNTCHRRHNTVLCPASTQHRGSTPSTRKESETSNMTPMTHVARVDHTSTHMYLPSLMAEVMSEQGASRPARILLDSGSTASYVNEAYAHALKAELQFCPPQTVYAFGGATQFSIQHQTTLLLKKESKYVSLSLQVMPSYAVAPIDVPMEELCRLAHDHGVKVSPGKSAVEEVDILLGVHDINQHVRKIPEKAVRLGGSLIATESTLGWHIQGGQDGKCRSSKSRTFLTTPRQSECMYQTIDQLLRDPLSSKSGRDLSVDEWARVYLEQVKFDPQEKRWIVPLPWLNDQRPENNRAIVYKATEQQLKRSSERGLREKYDEAISAYLRDDQAEEVYDDPIHGYYIPHHAVLKAGSTTEVRVVMNASFARKGQLSLNDTLYKGQSDQNDLFSLLLRWRSTPYAVTADLKKAFLQIRIREEDRPYMRYFWAPEGSSRLRTFQMKSVMFGAAPSPCQLYMVLRKMFETAHEEGAREMIRNFYMDDIFFLGEDAQTVLRQMEATKQILAHASFSTHKWASPKWMAAEGFGEHECQETVKCLGMQWNLADDTIGFHMKETTASTITRREVARYFGRLFDPHGLIGPFHTRQKLFMRKVLLSAKGWDEPLKDELVHEARARFEELDRVRQVKIPRIALKGRDYELWGFADASKEAYGAVMYVRQLEEDRLHLLASRSRLVSEKRTIPELELCAAVLLTELSATIQKDLDKAVKVRYFTDSMVTLGRISNPPNKYEQYVANRLAKIAHESTPDQWNFVSTKVNPADALSRGMSLSELEKLDLWFQGPDPKVLEVPSQENPRTHVIQLLPKVETFRLDAKLLDLPYDKLMNFLVAYYKVMDRHAGISHNENEDHESRCSLRQLAAAAAWRLFQRVVFPKEVNCLKKGESLPKDSKLYKLDVFLDKRNVMRLNRRLEHACLDYEAKFPVVAVDHPFVRGFLENFHETTMAHASLKTLDTQVRLMLHLPGQYNILKSIVSKCPRCQWLHETPFNAPPASLPADRVSNATQRPFEHVGVDLFGPLESGARKYYGMVFACANTRAVHLELLPTRQTQSILRAMDRFMSRRGVPRVIRSDNERGFHQSDQLLRYLHGRKFRRHVESTYNTTWKFQPAKSPFWGGFFERLIGIIKRTMANWPLLRTYTQEELTTIMTRVEALVNSRPLVAATQGSSMLSPADFLVGRSLVFTTPVPMDLEKPVDAALINYSHLEKERQALWTRLKHEYLVRLRQFHRIDRTREPIVGELVLIMGQGKREEWEWGRIHALLRGPDGYVRAAQLEMPSGQLWERPVQALIPLESTSREGGCGDSHGSTKSMKDPVEENQVHDDMPSVEVQAGSDTPAPKRPRSLEKAVRPKRNAPLPARYRD